MQQNFQLHILEKNKVINTEIKNNMFYSKCHRIELLKAKTQ